MSFETQPVFSNTPNTTRNAYVRKGQHFGEVEKQLLVLSKELREGTFVAPLASGLHDSATPTSQGLALLAEMCTVEKSNYAGDQNGQRWATVWLASDLVGKKIRLRVEGGVPALPADQRALFNLNATGTAIDFATRGAPNADPATFQFRLVNLDGNEKVNNYDPLTGQLTQTQGDVHAYFTILPFAL